MWDELVVFAREKKVSNIVEVLAQAAEYKKQKNDTRGCAILYAELAFEIYKSGGSSSGLVHALEISTTTFIELNMFEDAMNVAKKCNHTDSLVKVSLAWM